MSGVNSEAALCGELGVELLVPVNSELQIDRFGGYEALDGAAVGAGLCGAGPHAFCDALNFSTRRRSRSR